MQVYFFLKPFLARNLEANVTSISLIVQWKYDTQNSEKSPIIMYELWYMISGGSPALKQITWSDIVNYTGPHIFLSCTFQNILKPHINYSTINGLNTERTMQSQSKINLSWRSRQLLYSCILNKKKSSIFLDQMISLKKLCDHNEYGCWIFNNMLERYQWYRTLYRMFAAAWFN